MWELIDDIWVYVPRHFNLEEFFPKSMKNTIHLVGELLWTWIDARVTITADNLRELYGPAIMNTWHFNDRLRNIYGTHQYRGYRPLDCPIGATLSQHKQGRASDLTFPNHRVEDIREDILSQPTNPMFKYIMALELDVNWLHFDCRPHDRENEGIFLFSS